jgi:hypothetical protein
MNQKELLLNLITHWSNRLFELQRNPSSPPHLIKAIRRRRNIIASHIWFQ